MSTTVDERVVSLEFDNSRFQKNMQDTEALLASFEDKLMFKNAGEGFSKIEEASANVKFNKFAEAIDNINYRFSTMGIAATKVLTDIVGSVERAAKQMVNKFAIAPIMDGLGEYQTQMDSIATLKLGSGKETKEVLTWLDDLNEYADNTVYNFTQMTQAFGRQVLAGVNPEQSLEIIKGYMNLAAGHGVSNARAMGSLEQLNQALTKGFMALEDYKSLENASMVGTKEQEVIMETAREAGVDVDSYIEKYGNFRDSLTKGQWLTTDILAKAFSKFNDESHELGSQYKKAASQINTLSKMTDELREHVGSTWSKTWRLIIGDLDQAGELFGYLAHDVIEPVMDALNEPRNEMLQSWSDLGGRAKALSALKDILSSLGAIASTVKKALEEVFPPITGKTLVDLTNKVAAFVKQLKPTDQVLNDIKNVAKGVFSILKLGFDILAPILSSIIKIAAMLTGPLTAGLLHIVAPIGIFITNLEKIWATINPLQKLIDIISVIFDELGKTFYAFNNVISVIFTTIDGELLKNGINIKHFVGGIIDWFLKLFGLADAGDILADPFKKAVDAIKNFFAWIRNGVTSTTFLQSVIDAVRGSFDRLFKFFNMIKSSGIGEFFSFVAGKIVEFAQTIINWFKSLGDINTGETFKFVDDSNEKVSILTKIGEGFIAVWNGLKSIFEKIKPVIDSVWGAIAGAATWAWDGIIHIWESIKGAMASTTSSVGNGLSTVWDAIKNGFSAAFDFIKGALADIGKFLAENFGQINIWDVLKGAIVAGTGGGIIKILMNIGDAIKNIGGLFGKAGGIMEGVKGVLDSIGGFIDNLGKTMILKEVTPIIKEIGTTLLKLVAAIVILSLLNTDKAIQGIGLVTTLIVELYGLFAGVKGGSLAMGVELLMGATRIIKSLSNSVLKLTAALLVLSLINADKAITGIWLMAAMLGELTGAVILLQKGMGKGVIKLSEAAFVIDGFGKTMIKMAIAMAILSLLDPNKLVGAVLALAAGLAALSGAVILIQQFGAVAAAGSVKIIKALSQSFIKIALALAILSLLDVGKMYAAVGAVALVLTAMTGAIIAISVFSQYATDLRAIGKLVKIFSNALIKIAAAFLILAPIPWQALLKGGVALAGTMAVMAAIVIVLSKMNLNLESVSRALMGVSLAILILAVSIIAMSVLPVVKGTIATNTLIKVLQKVSKIDTSGAVRAAVAMVIFAGAMILMGTALMSFVWIPLPSLAAGLLAIIALTGWFAMLTNFVNPAMIVETAGAFALFGVAIIALCVGLSVLQEFTFEDGWQGLVALIVLMAAFVGLMYLLAPIASIVMFVSTAFLLFGAAILLVSIGLAILNAVLPEFSEKLITALPNFVEAFNKTTEAILSGLDMFLESLSKHIPNIVRFLVELISGVIIGLVEPIFKAITKLLTLLAAYVPQFVELAGEIVFGTIWGILKAAANWIGPIVDETFRLIVNFLNALNRNFRLWNKKIANELSDLFTNLLDLAWETLKSLFTKLADWGYQMGTEIGNNLKNIDWNQVGTDIINAILGGMKSIVDGAGKIIGDIGNSILGWFNDVFGISSPSKETEQMGEYLMEGLDNGLENKLDESKKTIGMVGNNLLGDMKSTFGNFDINSMMNNDAFNLNPSAFGDISKSLEGIGGTANMNLDIEPTDPNVLAGRYGSLTDIFGGKLGMMQNMNFGDFKIDSFDQKQFVNVKMDDSDILGSLNNMNSTMDDIKNNMSGMQVNLDGDTMVGELAPRLNDQLGDMTTLNMRGVL